MVFLGLLVQGDLKVAYVVDEVALLPVEDLAEGSDLQLRLQLHEVPAQEVARAHVLVVEDRGPKDAVSDDADQDVAAVQVPMGRAPEHSWHQLRHPGTRQCSLRRVVQFGQTGFAFRGRPRYVGMDIAEIVHGVQELTHSVVDENIRGRADRAYVGVLFPYPHTFLEMTRVKDEAVVRGLVHKGLAVQQVADALE